MKLQQLRVITEVANHGLNVSAAADSLFASQPGLSKQIRLLEEELGVQIFERHGKSLTAITPVGRAVLDTAEKMLIDAGNIKNIANEFKSETAGTLTLGTTHTQARYVLPNVIRAFRERYPDIRLQIQQGNPKQIAQWAALGQVDFAIATEAMELFEDLVMMPCYQWNRCLLLPQSHELAGRPSSQITLETLARHPLITYVTGFTGRNKVDNAFLQAGLEPNWVLTAVDADVIKTYVRLGLGIGITANMAYDPAMDQDLAVLDASHLFPPSTTRIAFRRGSYLRRYMYEFISLFAPHLEQSTVDEVAAGKTNEARRRLALALEDHIPFRDLASQ